ncbi:hypothetical protein ACIBFB_07250 [Nocardiopsis sp. NPDC050513]|uniref:hypothetical protein n=1 Tax=Nocardiopsis sp. NPDC050513 TaxID=3364338 RepID=UPI003788012F
MSHPHPAAPRHRQRVTVAPLVRLFGFLLPVPFVALSTAFYLRYEAGPATAYVLVVLAAGVLVSLWISRVASVRIQVRDGVLTLSRMPFLEAVAPFLGEVGESRHARLRADAIVYAGGARFRLRDITLRTDGNFTKRRPGQGMEFVTGDGDYLIARVRDVEGLKRALLAHGTHPSALRAPFPRGIGSPDTLREARRPYPDRQPPYGR